MSLLTLAHFCSHLQNATKARLGVTSVPYTRQNLSVSLLLMRSGLLSSVMRGSRAGPDQVPTPVTQSNISSRRLWLGLKYFDNEPVLSKLKMVSRPKQDLRLGVAELAEVIRGRRAGYVDGLQPGEVLVLRTDRGLVEAREAVERRVGGEVLFRAS